MIEFDIDIKIEKMLLKILKGKTKKFLKYLEENNIDVEDEEEIDKSLKKFKEKENKTIFGINKVLLAYTLALIIERISKKNREKFKNRITSELFKKSVDIADKRIKELYLSSAKRTAYYVNEVIRKSKTGAEDFVLKDKWEEAKEKVEERMGYSDLLNSNNVLGETQAEYVKIILEELGIKGFIWVTKHDDRVRAKHSWREGKLFDMNGNLLKGVGEDSAKILPKQEWGCRCRMAIDEKAIEEALNNVA